MASAHDKDHSPRPVDLAAESVAGEEDPGASIELATSGKPQDGGRAADAPQRRASMQPGDEAPEGSRASGEDVCPACGGSGRRAGQPCPDCGGTGKVTVGIGGG